MLGVLSLLLIVGNVLLTHSWLDGVGMALLTVVIATCTPGLSGRPRKPQWAIGGARFWIVLGAVWLLYALLDWPVRGSFLIAAGRATMLVGAGVVLVFLIRKRRSKPAAAADCGSPSKLSDPSPIIKHTFEI